MPFLSPTSAKDIHWNSTFLQPPILLKEGMSPFYICFQTSAPTTTTTITEAFVRHTMSAESETQPTASKHRRHKINNTTSHFTNYMTTRHSKSSNPRRIAVVSQTCINIGVIVITVKNALIDPVTFQPPNHIISRISQGSFPTPSLNTLGSFVFELCSRQTNKQTDSNIVPTMTDSIRYTSTAYIHTYIHTYCIITYYFVGKLSAMGQPKRPTQPFILLGSINE